MLSLLTVKSVTVRYMTNKLDCVKKVLQSHRGRDLDHVDPASDFIEADTMTRLPSKEWLLVELRYDLKQGLSIDKISSCKEIEKDVQPSLSKFKDVTKERLTEPYVKGLFQLLNDDIKRECK
jgi:hypothetical protein